MVELASRRIVFVDETGINLTMARRYGRARTGERAIGSVPKNYGAGVSLIGAIDRSGMVASFSVQGATDTQAMIVFLREALLPCLNSGDVLIWDNLSVHKTHAVQLLFEQAASRVVVFAAVFT